MLIFLSLAKGQRDVTKSTRAGLGTRPPHVTPMGVPDPQAGVLNLCTCSDPVPNSFTTRKGRIHSPFHVPRVRFGSHILLDVPSKHEIFYIAQNSIF